MAAHAYKHEEIAQVPHGWRVRTVTRGTHQVRIAFPPGPRKKGSGKVVEILHPGGEANPSCIVSHKAKSNPAELLIFGNPAKGTKFDVYGKKYRGATEAEAKKRALKDRSLRGQRAARKTFGENPMDAHDRKHLSAWIKSSGYRGKEAAEVRRKILSVVKEYPEVLQSPGSRSWPEILRLANSSKLDKQRAARERAERIRDARRHPTNPRRRVARTYGRPNKDARMRSNPSETEEAVKLFESFHGKDAKSIVEKQVSAAIRLDYAALGDLQKLIVKTPLGEKAEFNFEGDRVTLASSPDGKQLYCIGGNQNLSNCLDAKSLEKDLIDLGECVQVEYLARKIHANYQPVVYYHKMGEKTGDRPRLMFDKLRKQIFFIGGAYYIEKDKGVSPGIEN